MYTRNGKKQQICLLKTTDSVKEKAMNKLKEVKSKSDDTGSKARTYLEGLLKIPFGIYKTEPILHFSNEISDLFKDVVVAVSRGPLPANLPAELITKILYYALDIDSNMISNNRLTLG